MVVLSQWQFTKDTLPYSQTNFQHLLSNPPSSYSRSLPFLPPPKTDTQNPQSGPYDELLLVPGVFRVPTKPTTRRRITRIYVSQRETCYNGRHNWNIPKHLARFTFSSPAGTPGPLTLAVYAPDPSAKAPFFSATLTPFRWLPAIPLSTRFLPLSTTLAQPPVPAAAPPPAAGSSGPDGDGDGGSDAAADANANADASADADAPATDPALLCGTQHWRSMPINSYSPATRGMWVTVHAPGTGPYAAGAGKPSGARLSEAETAEAVAEATRWWPVAARPWPVGVWMDGGEMEIPAPVEWKL